MSTDTPDEDRTAEPATEVHDADRTTDEGEGSEHAGADQKRPADDEESPGATMDDPVVAEPNEPG